MAWLLPVAMLASTAVGVFGAGQQGKAAKRQANDQAAASLRDAATLREQAAVQRQQSGVEEDALRADSRAFLADQQGSIAESGFENSGTMRDLAGDADAKANLDALSFRYQGEMRARAIESDAVGLVDQAGQYRAQGKQAGRASRISAVGQLFGGAASYTSADLSLGSRSLLLKAMGP